MDSNYIIPSELYELIISRLNSDDFRNACEYIININNLNYSRIFEYRFGHHIKGVTNNSYYIYLLMETLRKKLLWKLNRNIQYILCCRKIDDFLGLEIFSTDRSSIDVLKIYEIPKEISILSNLRVLKLDKNKIREIPMEICWLNKLEILNLHNNAISEIPKEISGLTSLKKLNLGDNQISEVPKDLCRLVNLQILNLSKNQIKEIPLEISGLHSLRELNLSCNLIDKVSKETSSKIFLLTNLEVLNLRKNKGIYGLEKLAWRHRLQIFL